MPGYYGSVNADLWSYCSLVALALVSYWCSSWIKAVILAFRLPGPAALPFLGNALILTDQKKLFALGSTGVRDYGSLIRIWLTIIPAIIVTSPRDIQTILSSNKHTDKIPIYKVLKNFLGEGLITSSGTKWQTHRKLIQPTFHLTILEQFIKSFGAGGHRLVDELKDAPNQRAINITSYVNNCILGILHDVVLGVETGHHSSGSNEVSPFRNAKVVLPYRMSRPWLMFSWIYKLTDLAKSEMKNKTKLYDYIRKIVEERREERSAQSIANSIRKRTSLLDRMIDLSENHANFDTDDIVDEVATFMLAGQESVGTAVTFCLYLMGKHQDVQQQAFEELDSIFEDSVRQPTLADLRAMRYLEQCIKETIRLYPSVPVIARTITQDIRMGKHTLPAGCQAIIVPYLTHRIPDIYPQPEKFNPDRFLPEKVEERHTYAFIPFSAGPRNCIGHKFGMMEMKTVVSTVLRQFHLSIVPGHEDFQLNYRITLRAKGGVWLALDPRNKRTT